MRKYLTGIMGSRRMSMTTYPMFAIPLSEEIRVDQNHLSLPKGKIF